ncbi:mitochondrial ornithine carrier protein AmcA/Ort1 [Purpureocillium lilacinum]|uniref:Mitochondrial ornithine carrier protein AmcA/Ort1 n=1 Tax=Purpureocillium lilacinum TaxID=33203 RepID=A0A179HNG7_PURLI|nr:mitochondrial ornithine carrier protein AmcA/Ort1 [Purpureocillium lilacinum]OAQ91009.1 mitochondrial ornithine carrier protein AmcA/Ort1 [Purpureocillium lilacinum]
MPSPMLRSASSNAAVSSTCKSHGLTQREFRQLRDSAVAAKDTAYCPYSKFRVGAALLGPKNRDGDEDEEEDEHENGEEDEEDKIVTGANVENASYPVGTCAERVALGNAVTRPGWRRHARGGFRALAVATDVSPPASPCGMCRQFIREFCSMEMPVIMFDKKDQYLVLTVEQLLPSSFGPNDLPPPDNAE